MAVRINESLSRALQTAPPPSSPPPVVNYPDIVSRPLDVGPEAYPVTAPVDIGTPYQPPQIDYPQIISRPLDVGMPLPPVEPVDIGTPYQPPAINYPEIVSRSLDVTPGPVDYAAPVDIGEPLYRQFAPPPNVRPFSPFAVTPFEQMPEFRPSLANLYRGGLYPGEPGYVPPGIAGPAPGITQSQPSTYDPFGTIIRKAQEPLLPESALERIGGVPFVGRPLRSAAESLTPFNIATTILTAALGPAVAGGLEGAGPLGTLVGSLVRPFVEGGLARRAAVEMLANALAQASSAEVLRVLPEGTPEYARVAAALGAGALSIGAAGAGVLGARAGLRAAGEAAPAVRGGIGELTTSEVGGGRIPIKRPSASDPAYAATLTGEIVSKHITEPIIGLEVEYEGKVGQLINNFRGENNRRISVINIDGPPYIHVPSTKAIFTGRTRIGPGGIAIEPLPVEPPVRTTEVAGTAETINSRAQEIISNTLDDGRLRVTSLEKELKKAQRLNRQIDITRIEKKLAQEVDLLHEVQSAGPLIDDASKRGITVSAAEANALTIGNARVRANIERQIASLPEIRRVPTTKMATVPTEGAGSPLPMTEPSVRAAEGAGVPPPIPTEPPTRGERPALAGAEGESVVGVEPPGVLAVTPTQRGAMPMAQQKEILGRAGVGKPGLSIEGHTIIYRNHQGVPVGYLEIVETNRGRVVETLVTDAELGLARGRVVKSLLDEAQRQGIVGAGGTVTPEAQRLIEGLQRRGVLGAEPTPPRVPQFAEYEARAGREGGHPPPGGEGGAPPPGGTPPPGPGGTPPPKEPPLPRLHDVEMRSAPLPPEMRAQLAGGAPTGPFRIEPYEEVATRFTGRMAENWWNKLNDVFNGTIVRQEPEAQVVRRAMTTRDFYVATQNANQSAAIRDWQGRVGVLLGLRGDGIAHNIPPLPGLKIPKGALSTLEDILRHAGDYKVTAEQLSALREGSSIQEAAMRQAQAQGVDIQAQAGPYWGRVVVGGPKGWEKRLGGSGGTPFPRVTPASAKSPYFIDKRAGIEAGFKYANDLDAMMAHQRGLVEAIANRQVTREVAAMGFKPSEKVSQDLAQQLRDARTEFIAARTEAVKEGANADVRARFLAAESKVDLLKRAMRLEAKRTAEMQPKVFGRITTPEVAESFNSYLKDGSPSLMQEISQLIRAASVTTGDDSVALTQLGLMMLHHPQVGLYATIKSLEGAFHDPVGFTASHADAIARGTRLGAIQPPSEFLLGAGGRFAQLPLRVPILGTALKTFQRMFETGVYVAQTLRWETLESLAKTPDELIDLAEIGRKEVGSALMPGMTRGQRSFAQLWFAPRFLTAITSQLTDAARIGVAGTEARKNLGKVIVGGIAAVIAGNMVEGHTPNLTDPDKPGFLGIRAKQTYVYPFGPLQPLLVALYRSGRAIYDASQGDTPRPSDMQAGPRLLEGKINILPRLFVRALEAMGAPVSNLRGEPFRGPAFGEKGDLMTELMQYTPIGLTQALQGLQKGSGLTPLEIFGGRTTPVSSTQKFGEQISKETGKDITTLSTFEEWEAAQKGSPELRSAFNARLADLKSRDPEMGNYIEARIANRQERDKTLSELEAQRGQSGLTGVDLRHKLQGALELEATKNREAIGPTLAKRLDEMPAPEDKDYASYLDYLKTIYAPGLEDQYGVFDFKAYQARIDAGVQKYGAEKAAEFEARRRDDPSPLVREFRNDTEKIRESGYWDMRDKAFEYWRQYNKVPEGMAEKDYWRWLQGRYTGYAAEMLDRETPNWRQTKPDAASRLAEVEVEKKQAQFNQGLSQVRENWFSKDWVERKAIYDILLKWGYGVPGKRQVTEQYAGVGTR